MLGNEEMSAPLELPIEVENQLVAGQIQWSIDRAAQTGHAVFGETAAVFKGRDNPDFEVNLHKYQGGIVGLPEEFEYPTYRFQV